MKRLGASKWRCDKCGEVIENAAEGYLEWVAILEPRGAPRAQDFHIVHHLTASPYKEEMPDQGCYYNEQQVRANTGGRGSVANGPIEWYLGPQGLLNIIRIATETPVPMVELLELFKRLYVPGYDLVRPYLSQAENDGLISPDRAKGFYLMEEIDTVLKHTRHLQGQAF